jgi:hypothetical protein
LSDVAKAWKQYTAPDGRPYFYNKITKESKWVMPEEMKQAAAAAAGGQTAGARVQKGAAESCSTHTWSMLACALFVLCHCRCCGSCAAIVIPTDLLWLGHHIAGSIHGAAVVSEAQLRLILKPNWHAPSVFCYEPLTLAVPSSLQ